MATVKIRAKALNKQDFVAKLQMLLATSATAIRDIDVIEVLAVEEDE